jgi:cell division protein FtsB
MKFRFTAINLLNVAGMLIVLYLVVVLAQTVKHNYDLNQQITDLKNQITILSDQKEALGYLKQYYGTDSFQEREARAKLNLQMPGESVIVLPHSSPTPSASASDSSHATKSKSNWQQWLNFLSGNG